MIVKPRLTIQIRKYSLALPFEFEAVARDLGRRCLSRVVRCSPPLEFGDEMFVVNGKAPSINPLECVFELCAAVSGIIDFPV
jgi:hypothetical protein